MESTYKIFGGTVQLRDKNQRMVPLQISRSDIPINTDQSLRRDVQKSFGMKIVD